MAETRANRSRVNFADQNGEIKSFHVIVFGRVQGVFFRSGLKEICDSLSVKGWVKNKPDGTVEAVFHGREGDVNRAIDWCKRGPERAEVTRVETHEVRSEGVHGSFEIIH